MKAQLVLIGGRSSVPTILTVLDQQPEVIFALTSPESHAQFSQFKDLVNKWLPSSKVEELDSVDAFDCGAIENRCREAFQRFPDAQWICNITAATTIMSIAVYKQAEIFQHTCWYLNTAKARIITLVGPRPGEERENAFFHLSVEQYIEAWAYSLENGDMEERRSKSEQEWLTFAYSLGQNPLWTIHLKEAMKAIDKSAQQKPGKNGAKRYCLRQLSQETHEIIEKAERFGLAQKVKSESGILEFTLDYIQYNFLNGGWLEVYVWNEAKQIQSLNGHALFDDCHWNRKITVSGVTRELDVILAYRAQLILIECKTGDETKNTDTLDGLTAVADALGGKFVGKILVSTLFSPSDTDPDQIQSNGIHREQKKGHEKFLAKARQQRIVVIMAEDLPHVRNRLEQEATRPTYPRI